MRSLLLLSLLTAPVALASAPYGSGLGSAEYVFSPATTVPILDGPISISGPNGMSAPTSGYFPFWVDLRSGVNKPVKLTVRVNASSNGVVVSKDVELKPGESRRVFLPVPTTVTGAQIEVDGLGGMDRSGVYFSSYLNTSLLAIGSEDEFREFVGKGPSTTTPDVSVLALPSSELPEELSAYVGFSGVVLLGRTVESLTEAQRRVLEQYAATGGLLAIERKSRGVDQYLPMSREVRGDELLHYGFGRLLACDPERAGCGEKFINAAYTSSIAVKPVGPQPAYARGPFASRYYYNDRPSMALLAQAAPPVGRFLVIMILFTLLVGPGSLYVARKRGPLFVLITIPAVAFITCASIAGYSALVDGFQVHATTRGYTLLDRRGGRAITASLEAFYANLAATDAQFGTADAVLFPADRYSTQAADIRWEGGAHMGGDFIPSRSYREWGVVSVSPTRARLSLKSSNGISALNALGGRVSRLVVKKDGAFYEATDLADGGEAALKPTKEPLLPNLTEATDRFAANISAEITRPLREGEFVAWLEGPGLTPLGGLRTEHAGDQHVIRGEAD